MENQQKDRDKERNDRWIVRWTAEIRTGIEAEIKRKGGTRAVSLQERHELLEDQKEGWVSAEAFADGSLLLWRRRGHQKSRLGARKA